ncbi:NAD(P)-binding protein [Biscogniauxia marginata]|nr:NAD(P)-binding protein [Biscogniauxia marginata]
MDPEEPPPRVHFRQITGAAGDLGRQTAIELARYGRPARIYVADLPHDEDAKVALAQQITYEAYGDFQPDTDVTGQLTEIRFLELDLSSLDSVRKCAADFVAQEKQLDIIFLNTGIIRVATGVTTEGYEIHFGVNYLGHALLSSLLPGADVRIVIVSSEGHLNAPKDGIDFNKLKTDCADIPYAKRYGQNKVALISLMRQLSREYCNEKQLRALVHLTRPIAPLICVPVSVGIRNHLWAATSSYVVSSTYYEPVGVPGKLSPAAKDESLSKRLRQWTNDAVSEVKSLE